MARLAVIGGLLTLLSTAASAEPVAKPVAKPTAEKTAAKPTTKPTAEKPTAKPAAKPTAEKPTAKPAAKPTAVKPAAKPTAATSTDGTPAPTTATKTATTAAATDDKPAANAPPAPAAVNLFPKSVFATDPTLQPLRETGPRQRAETPAGASFSLGDDRDWRVQAAQIGVMAGLFAALVAICNGGACMLRDEPSPAAPPERDGEVLRQDRKPSW